MAERTLTITVNPDWRGALRSAAGVARSAGYQGERLNFETPGVFFRDLTARRWALVEMLMGAGELGVRELARRAERDVKRVHEDVERLSELGLVERTDHGGVICPYGNIHVDMHLHRKANAA